MHRVTRFYFFIVDGWMCVDGVSREEWKSWFTAHPPLTAILRRHVER